jgi:hypothetical protein
MDNVPIVPAGSLTTLAHGRIPQPNLCLSLTRIQIPFKELQKRITTSLVHKTYPLSSNVLRVRYQLSIIQRTSCLIRLLVETSGNVIIKSSRFRYPADLSPSILSSLILPLRPDQPPSFELGVQR